MPKSNHFDSGKKAVGKIKTDSQTSVNILEYQKFYNAVEQTADGIFITDRKGIIEYVNPAFETLTGYTKREALGNTPRIVKSGLREIDFYKNMWETILSGRTFRAIVVNRRKDGTLFYADHTITPIKDSSGEITHFVGIWKDVTHQTELERQKDEFIRIASHELKTPMAIVKSYIQILKHKPKSVGSFNKENLLIAIEDNINSLTRLVQELFDASQIESDKLKVKKEKIQIDKLIKQTVDEIKSIAASHKLISKVETKKVVIGDKDRIKQVLINLITNAVKYSPSGGKVIVDARPGEDFLIIKIKDFSKGIPRKYQKKIFEKYFTVNKKEEGVPNLGLGLYICAEIIKRHNGKIWVESVEGKGSTFSFTLPLVKESLS